MTNRRHESTEWLGLVALLTGALATGVSGIFVRLSETGPTATAFWRGMLALPLLAIWAALEPRRLQLPGTPPTGRFAGFRGIGFLAAGFFFAGDLVLWHWSLLLTSIALSTLEASLAPLVVTALAWILWGQRPRMGFLGSLVLALVGLLLMMGPKLRTGGSSTLLGDVLGLATACFYGAYILVVARLRERYSTATVMFNTTAVFTLLLFPLALTQKFLPDTLFGWAMLAGCSLGAQILGQGLIAYALAHLPATFSSVGLYVQVIGAAVCAWLVLDEHLTGIQILGACVVSGAIAMARATAHPPGKPAASRPQPA